MNFDRYITIVPEIDLPGHMQAALAAYPELGCTGGPYKVWEMWGVSDNVLCAGNDKTMKFVDDVLKEVVALFPSKYIHVGGDGQVDQIYVIYAGYSQASGADTNTIWPHRYLLKSTSLSTALQASATIYSGRTSLPSEPESAP